MTTDPSSSPSASSSSSSSLSSSSSWLDEPPPPRRSDEAFILAVRTDLHAARASWTALGRWRWAPLSGLALAGVLVAVTLHDATAPPSPPGSELAAAIEADVVAQDESPSLIDVIDAIDAIDDDASLLALHGSIEPAPSFAFAELDGSTEYDLKNIEAAFDQALAPL
jgi:hypothetical protein